MIHRSRVNNLHDARTSQLQVTSEGYRPPATLSGTSNLYKFRLYFFFQILVGPPKKTEKGELAWFWYGVYHSFYQDS